MYCYEIRHFQYPYLVCTELDTLNGSSTVLVLYSSFMLKNSWTAIQSVTLCNKTLYVVRMSSMSFMIKTFLKAQTGYKGLLRISKEFQNRYELLMPGIMSIQWVLLWLAARHSSRTSAFKWFIDLSFISICIALFNVSHVF